MPFRWSYLSFIFYIKNNCRVFKITPEFDIGIIRSGQLFKGLIKKKICVILSTSSSSMFLL